MSRYIDADALKKRVSELIVPDWTRTLIRSWLDSEPTVDAVPVRHAEWRPHPIKGCEEWDVCSACGIGTHRRLVSDLGEEEYSYSYCPWCGAKMDGERRTDEQQTQRSGW